MFEETLNTLKYANRAKEIKVQVEENKKVVELHVAEYKNIIDDLRKELDELNKISRSKAVQQPPSDGKMCPACQISSEAEQMIEEFKEALDEQIQLRKKVCEIKAQNMQNQVDINKARKSASQDGDTREAFSEIESLEKSVDFNRTIKKDIETQIQELSQHANNLLGRITKKLKSEDSKLVIEKIFQIKAIEVENLELELNLKFYEKLNGLLAGEYKQIERQLLQRNIDFGSTLNVRQLEDRNNERNSNARISERPSSKRPLEMIEETDRVVRRISARNRFEQQDEVEQDDQELEDDDEDEEIEIDDSGLYISKTNEQIDEMKQKLRESGIYFEDNAVQDDENAFDDEESRYLGVGKEQDLSISREYHSEEEPEDDDDPARNSNFRKQKLPGEGTIELIDQMEFSKGISIDPRIELKRDPRRSSARQDQMKDQSYQPAVPQPVLEQDDNASPWDEWQGAPAANPVSRADMMNEMNLLNTVDKSKLQFDPSADEKRIERFSTVRADSRKDRLRWNATINWGEEFRLYQGESYPESCGCLDGEIIVNEKDFEELLDDRQLRLLRNIELGESDGDDEF